MDSLIKIVCSNRTEASVQQKLSSTLRKLPRDKLTQLYRILSPESTISVPTVGTVAVRLRKYLGSLCKKELTPRHQHASSVLKSPSAQSSVVGAAHAIIRPNRRIRRIKREIPEAWEPIKIIGTKSLAVMVYHLGKILGFLPPVARMFAEKVISRCSTTGGANGCSFALWIMCMYAKHLDTDEYEAAALIPLSVFKHGCELTFDTVDVKKHWFQIRLLLDQLFDDIDQVPRSQKDGVKETIARDMQKWFNIVEVPIVTSTGRSILKLVKKFRAVFGAAETPRTLVWDSPPVYFNDLFEYVLRNDDTPDPRKGLRNKCVFLGRAAKETSTHNIISYCFPGHKCLLKLCFSVPELSLHVKKYEGKDTIPNKWAKEMREKLPPPYRKHVPDNMSPTWVELIEWYDKTPLMSQFTDGDKKLVPFIGSVLLSGIKCVPGAAMVGSALTWVGSKVPPWINMGWLLRHPWWRRCTLILSNVIRMYLCAWINGVDLSYEAMGSVLREIGMNDIARRSPLGSIAVMVIRGLWTCSTPTLQGILSCLGQLASDKYSLSLLGYTSRVLRMGFRAMSRRFSSVPIANSFFNLMDGALDAPNALWGLMTRRPLGYDSIYDELSPIVFMQGIMWISLKDFKAALSCLAWVYPPIVPYKEAFLGMTVLIKDTTTLGDYLQGIEETADILCLLRELWGWFKMLYGCYLKKLLSRLPDNSGSTEGEDPICCMRDFITSLRNESSLINRRKEDSIEYMEKAKNMIEKADLSPSMREELLEQQGKIAQQWDNLRGTKERHLKELEKRLQPSEP